MQGDLFRKPIPPAAPIPVEPARRPGKERAGTRLDHRHTIEVHGYKPEKRRTELIGHIDTSKNVFQCGGELKNFCYWKERLLTYPGDVWRKVSDTRLGFHISFLELIDNDANRCYRISFGTAMLEGRWYDAGIGRRWGVPMDLWTIHTEQLT